MIEYKEIVIELESDNVINFRLIYNEKGFSCQLGTAVTYQINRGIFYGNENKHTEFIRNKYIG